MDTEFTDDQINRAASVVRSCEISLCDGWRCDFCEPDCNCDEMRKTEALENIMEILKVSYHEADKFYDQYA